ncbi:FUN14 family-domain-containing protein [Gautieria morchelliformis]|nr:FUN14 family-domain-containing protein [Gautieria morchelliformis]
MMFPNRLLTTTTKISLRLSRTNACTLSAPYWSPARKGLTLATVQNSRRHHSTGRWLSVAGGVGLGLSASVFASPILCESTTPPGSRPVSPTAKESKEEPEKTNTLPPPPTSSVNLYQLSFGIVAGVSAGVFIKKGAKALAFFVGGIFVLLQYFNSLSLIKIDWGRAANKFESLFYTIDKNDAKRPPSISSLWRWLVDFLTADFQPRASFLAGLTLGLRIG